MDPGGENPLGRGHSPGGCRATKSGGPVATVLQRAVNPDGMRAHNGRGCRRSWCRDWVLLARSLCESAGWLLRLGARSGLAAKSFVGRRCDGLSERGALRWVDSVRDRCS